MGLRNLSTSFPSFSSVPNLIPSPPYESLSCPYRGKIEMPRAPCRHSVRWLWDWDCGSQVWHPSLLLSCGFHFSIKIVFSFPLKLFLLKDNLVLSNTSFGLRGDVLTTHSVLEAGFLNSHFLGNGFISNSVHKKSSRGKKKKRINSFHPQPQRQVSFARQLSPQRPPGWNRTPLSQRHLSHRDKLPYLLNLRS